MLAASRGHYFELLGAATTAAVQAAVAGDSLAPVEVATPGRAAELFRQLGLPVTFHAEVRCAWRIRWTGPGCLLRERPGVDGAI